VSEPRVRAASAVLATLGLGIAGYLSYVHYAGGTPACLAGGGCETVQRSSYAELGGVPVALLGALGYAAILVTLLVAGEAARAGAALLALVGFGFSAYLTYRELFTIHAVCAWCVTSAAIMTALAVLSAWRLLQWPAPEPESERISPAAGTSRLDAQREPTG
jgi:uncharacterized membrane protein